MNRTLIKDTIFCVDKKIKVSGFINNIRLHGKIIFIDIRDFSGQLQTVVTSNNEFYNLAQEIKLEWVIEIIGIIKERPEKMKNKNSETGDIEMEVENINVLSKAKTIPFSINTDGYEINEEMRMKYRYIDLRRERMKKNLKIRHDTILYCRNFLNKNNFIEIETPLLTKSTPEGARDFLVPSRSHPGSFYALPQSPQQYKQLLMVSGIEKYFQFARCMRDEDLRSDRLAEFTQLDIEMSYIDKEDIINLVERMVINIVKNLFPEKNITATPFPIMSYKEAMNKYGSDRPDIRKNPEDKNELAFLFIIDFPMFEKNKEGKWNAVHHPFTMPEEEDVQKIKNNPEKIKGRQVDLVLNGNEVAGGSIRSNNPKILEAVFSVLGHSKKDINEKFGHLFDAFSYGVPPHGGIAFGFERFLANLLNEKSIREVVAFPKTGDGKDLLIGAPSSTIEKKQLDELHIKNEKMEKSNKQNK